MKREIVGGTNSTTTDLMTEPSTDVIHGTLDLLILKTVSREPLHGYGIARKIEEISGEVFKVNPGSLITALRRLQRSGWLVSEWRTTENSRRARYYAPTAAGRRRLGEEEEQWRTRVAAMDLLLAPEL